MSDSSGVFGKELGERLRIARERAQLTQAEAAGELGVARTTLLAIEKGERKAKLGELQLLAQLYGSSVNTILRQEAIHLDLVPQFRKQAHATDREVEEVIQLFSGLVAAEVELENALGVRRQLNLPPIRPILGGDVREQAEHDATELRRWLGLGLAPISDICGLLESELGIRVYLRPLPSRISGLFAFSSLVGACMLLNSNQPARISGTAGHETGHFISTREITSLLLADDQQTSREDRYANAFSTALLMPANTVRRVFADLTAGQSQFTRRHVILLAAHFSVSREAIARRLEELRLVRSGLWDWFQANGGISNDQAREVLGDLAFEKLVAMRSAGPVPQRLALLAREAAKQGLYSEGQLSKLLHIDRLAVREVLSDLETEVSESSDQSQIIR